MPDGRGAGARPLTFIFLTVFLDLLGVGMDAIVCDFVVDTGEIQGMSVCQMSSM